jgi:hypothetical protein
MYMTTMKMDVKSFIHLRFLQKLQFSFDIFYTNMYKSNNHPNKMRIDTLITQVVLRGYNVLFI